MLAFIAKNHALTAIRKPQPRLRPGWALLRVRLAGICRRITTNHANGLSSAVLATLTDCGSVTSAEVAVERAEDDAQPPGLLPMSSTPLPFHRNFTVVVKPMLLG